MALSWRRRFPDEVIGILPNARFRFGLFIASLCVLQVFLGASPLILLISIVTGLVALIPVWIYGARHIVGAIFLWMAGNFTFVGLVVKSAFLQPIDSKLFQPELSFTVTLCGALAAVMGALLAAPIARRLRTVVPRVPALVELRLAGIISIILGLIFQFVSISTSDVGIQSIFGFVAPIFYFGIAAETTATIIASKGRKIISPTLLAALSIIFIVGLARNAKSFFLLSTVTYFLTVILTIGWRRVAFIFSVAAMLYVPFELVVTPAIHLVRAQEEGGNSLEFIPKTASIMYGIIVGDSSVLADLRGLNAEKPQTNYYSMNYIWNEPREIGTLDRFMAVPFVDAALRFTSWSGPYLGNKYIYDRLLDFLPNIFGIHKETEGQANLLMWDLGLLPDGDLAFLTVPMPAELFLYGGFASIFIFGPPIFFIACIVFSIFAGTVEANPFGTFVLVAYGSFVPMALFLSLEILSFRSVPTGAVMVFIVFQFARLMSGRAYRSRQWRTMGPSSLADRRERLRRE